jgi:integrative and conjugative element protein (TIGR02256 family)
MSEEIIWRIPEQDTAYILLHRDIFERLIDYRQVSAGMKEAGGLLIGYRRDPHIEVVDMTVPFPRDERRRTFFERRDPAHGKYLRKRWATSGKTLDYLGEWHTHPEQLPTPSYHDLYEWRLLLQSRRTPLLFLIVGITGAWMGYGTNASVRKCNYYVDSTAARRSSRLRIEVPE